MTHYQCVVLTVVVGLALHEQLLVEEEEVPVDEHDWQIDQLIVA